MTTERRNNLKIDEKIVAAETTAPNGKTIVGEASEKQIAEWKAQYGEVTGIEVDINENEVAMAYLRKPERLHIAKAMSHYAGKELLQAGEYLLNNLWLGGDPRCTTDKDISMSAAIAASGMVEFKETRLKKL